jgi:hypothetical protein
MYTKMKKLLAVAALAFIAGCSSKTTHTEERDLGPVVIRLEVTSGGGATGDEVYKLSAKKGGQSIQFFEGANPRHFHVAKTGENSITIDFCEGTIHRAQPIYFPPPDGVYLHVQPVLNCDGTAGGQR